MLAAATGFTSTQPNGTNGKASLAKSSGSGSPTEPTELPGDFLGDRFRRDTWFVGTVRSGGQTVTIKGNSMPGELRRGVSYLFVGLWGDDPKYGPQFLVHGFVESASPDRKGFVKYLIDKCAGIGKKTAEALHDAYDDQCLAVLRETPDRVVADGILAANVASDASRTLKENYDVERATVALTAMFTGLSFPQSAVREAIKKWGLTAHERLKRRPYMAMQLKGVGFGRADQLYLAAGHRPNAMKRQALFIEHWMGSDGAGHTWYDTTRREKDCLWAAVIKEIANAEPMKAILLARRARRITERGRFVTPTERANAERSIKESIERLLATAPKWGEVLPAPEGEPGPTEHQAKGIAAATMLPIGVLAGSPGTGKTYSLAAIITAMKKANPSLPIMVAAPTGKAAVRATESLAKNGVSLRARTVHKLLVPKPGDGGWNFQFDKSNQLDAGLLVVDEASMLDCSITSKLLEACPAGMHVLFVGDPNQLAPVGHGAPLRDLIAAGVPCGELREIKRNAGRIVQVCADMRDGKLFRAPPVFDGGVENLRLAESKTEDAQLSRLEETLKELKARGFDVLREVQILCPLNGKSRVSRVKINELLAPKLNPGERTGKWLVGDKVINLKNDYHPAVSEIIDLDLEATTIRTDAKSKLEIYVANGEIGFISGVEEGKLIIDFDSPKRCVKVAAGGESCPVDLAFAISIHKSQGSEWPAVIVIGDTSAEYIACRELWYTAISRASKECHIIGAAHTVVQQSQRVSLNDRKTFLADDVRELLARVAAEADV